LQLGDFDIAYGEAWLLETAVRAFIPLTFLAMSDEEIGLQFNHPGHHMNRDELLRTLCSQFEQGELVGYQEELGEHVPTAAQIEKAIVPPVRRANGGVSWGRGRDAPLCYGLSQAGAARWEQMAKPDWVRYFEDGWPEEDTCEVVAGSQSRLDELLGSTRELWDVEPVEGEIEREIISPWEATYWKTLPTVYRVRFRYQSAFYPGRGPTPEYRRMMIGLRRWCRSIWYPPEGGSWLPFHR
jgi:hypothetical protein